MMAEIIIEKALNTLRLVALATDDELVSKLCLDVLDESANTAKNELAKTCWGNDIDDLRKALDKSFGEGSVSTVETFNKIIR